MSPALIGLAWRGGAILLVVLALMFGYHEFTSYEQGIGAKRSDDAWTLKAAKQKADAQALLDAERGKTQAAEAELRKFKDDQEIQDAKNRKTVADLQGQLRTAAALNGGRLRDPNAQSGCGSGSNGAQGANSASPRISSDNGTETGGLLSVQLTDLLARLMSEADAINIAYDACRGDALNIRKALAP